MTTTDQSSLGDVERVQRAYPKIYLACHTRHVRATSTAEQLSARDSSLLAHLDLERPVTPASLARHLGIGRPTATAAIQHLESLGYITRAANPSDRRGTHLRLSEQGARAMRATSVLDPRRLADLLRRLSDSERARAIEGIELLAKAALETAAHFREHS